MSDYNLSFDFQDCSNFITAFENDDTSPKTLYTPSPQDILQNVPFIGDLDDGSDELDPNNDNSNYDIPSLDHANSLSDSSPYDSFDFGNPEPSGMLFNSPHSFIQSAYPSVTESVPSPPIKGEPGLMDHIALRSNQQQQQQVYPSPGSSVSSGGSSSGPSPVDQKLVVSNSDTTTSPSSTPATKTANSVNTKNSKVKKPRKEKSSHNVIEKRYRTNINDRILALRDCVPALRFAVSGGGKAAAADSLDGLTPASKLNKATVLTKATEYIVHLQSRNNTLQKELDSLRSLVDVKRSGNNTPNMSGYDSAGIGSSNSMSAPFFGSGSSSGMSSYNSSPVESFDAYPEQNNNQSSAASKFMMCSMAGLMASGLMGDENGAQGLSAVPMFSSLTKFHYGALDFSSLVLGFKLTLILGTVVYVFGPLFFGKPASSGFHGKSVVRADKSSDIKFSSRMSVSELRKQTWLASSQSMDFPSGVGIFSTIVDTFMTLFEVLVRFTLGFDGLKIARRLLFKSSALPDTNTMNRALDSQLCGGDLQNNYWRIFSGLLHGFLTPADATRFMLQAVEAAILAQFGPNFSRNSFHALAIRLWSKARASSHDNLPSHLRALLNSDIESNVIHVDAITRIRNLALGLPCSYQCEKTTNDSIYESVPLDPASVSTLDLISSFYAAKIVDEVVRDDVVNGEFDLAQLEIAKSVVPANSKMEQRIFVVYAMLLGPKNPKHVEAAMQNIKESIEHYKAESDVNEQETKRAEERRQRQLSSISEEADENSSDVDDEELEDEDEEEEDSTYQSDDTDDTDDSVSTIEPNKSSVAAPYRDKLTLDGKIALYSSFVRLYLAKGEIEHAIGVAKRLRLDPVNTKIGILGFDSLFKMLNELKDHKEVLQEAPKMESLAAVARLWIGSEEADKAGVNLKRRRSLVGDCVQISMKFGGFKSDEGYSSQ